MLTKSQKHEWPEHARATAAYASLSGTAELLRLDECWTQTLGNFQKGERSITFPNQTP